ncbi:hypothetical protein QR680_003551 [Steinernema hermaphroditum]|uniref:Uncharacterized protein n=1 Tax=Steinernema hermaphroditum TaxID=289476 RepID=A0AA39HN06_9BILA|nr:hypothetical protein QR680_003551 [Steinernema hermaphroditum]
MRSTGVLVFALLFFVASVLRRGFLGKASKSRNDYDQFYCDNFEAKDNNDSEVQYDDDYDSEFQYDDSGLQYYDDYDFEIEHDQFYYDADDYSEPSDDDFRGPDFKACIFHASLEQIIDIQTAKWTLPPARVVLNTGDDAISTTADLPSTADSSGHCPNTQEAVGGQPISRSLARSALFCFYSRKATSFLSPLICLSIDFANKLTIEESRRESVCK